MNDWLRDQFVISLRSDLIGKLLKNYTISFSDAKKNHWFWEYRYDKKVLTEAEKSVSHVNLNCGRAAKDQGGDLYHKMADKKKPAQQWHRMLGSAGGEASTKNAKLHQSSISETASMTGVCECFTCGKTRHRKDVPISSERLDLQLIRKGRPQSDFVVD